MPELDRWVLHRLAELDRTVRDGYAAFDFQGVFQALFQFATVDLSAFYFDVRKDALYCDPAGSDRRRAARTVLDALFHRLVTWLAPMLPFTMDEVWLSRFPGEDSSVHLVDMPATPAEWLDRELAAKWEKVRAVRRVVTGALEIERREKRIGASLEAAPVVHVADADLREALRTRRLHRRLHHLGPARHRAPRPRPAPSRSTTCRASPSSRRSPTARNAPAAGRSCPTSARTPTRRLRRCDAALA